MREIDPKIVGPGTWNVIHVLALISEEEDDGEIYNRIVYRIVHSFPCAKCRRHAIKYLDKNPITVGDEFAWSVSFHNSVNKRLGKPLMSTEEARDLYTNVEILMKNEHTNSTCRIVSPGNGSGGEKSECEDGDL